MSEFEIIEMYDRMDAAVVQLIQKIARKAGALCEDDEWLEARAYDYGIVGDVRDNIIKFLESLGYKFPDTDFDF